MISIIVRGHRAYKYVEIKYMGRCNVWNSLTGKKFQESQILLQVCKIYDVIIKINVITM